MVSRLLEADKKLESYRYEYLDDGAQVSDGCQ